MSALLESLLTPGQRAQAAMADAQTRHDNAAPAEPEDSEEDNLVACIEEAERLLAQARRLLADAVYCPFAELHGRHIKQARALMAEAARFLS